MDESQIINSRETNLKEFIQSMVGELLKAAREEKGVLGRKIVV